MKMARPRNRCAIPRPTPYFSVLTVGNAQQLRQRSPGSSRCPNVLPFLAEGKFTGVTLQGVKTSRSRTSRSSGPVDYRPNLFVTYWAFRAMIRAG